MYKNHYEKVIQCAHCKININPGEEVKYVQHAMVCLPCADAYYNCCSRYDNYLHDREHCDCEWRQRARQIAKERNVGV